MQIDVNVNMTLEVNDEDWEAYLDTERDEDGELDGPEDDYLVDFVDDALSGEEIQTHVGNAWVCSVDDCSILG